MKLLRRSISATRAASSAKGGTTSRAAAISAWRLLMAGSSYAEYMFQVADEVLVAALGLAGRVRDLGDGLAITGGHLDHDVHRLDAGNVAGQPRADAEAYVDTAGKCTVELQRLLEVEAIGEHQRLAHGVDAELLIVGDGFFRPLQRVAGVVAQAVEQLGEVQ